MRAFLRIAGEREDAVLDAFRTGVMAACVGPVTAGPLVQRDVPVVAPQRFRLGALIKELTDELPRRARRLRVAGGTIEVRGHAVLLDGVLHTLAPASMSILTALAARPENGTPARSADFVVMAGVAGLRWDDVDPQTTPTLWRMASEGSIGSLSVRSAHRPTCPVDGWLTVGAGSFAAWPGNRPTGTCPPVEVPVEQRVDLVATGHRPGRRHFRSSSRSSMSRRSTLRGGCTARLAAIRWRFEETHTVRPWITTGSASARSAS